MTFPSALIAYIDPGSGALLLQVLLASLLTLGVCFRWLLLAPFKLLWRRSGAPVEAAACSDDPANAPLTDGTD